MLDFIRQKSTSTVVLFIFGIIILVFVFWGFNPGGPSSTKNAVAIVNGHEISAGAYENLYKRELDRVRSQVGTVLTDEIIETLNLRQRALDMLINDILIIEEAKSRGFEASDKDVQELILSNPVFQRDGVFNKDYYFQLLDQNRLKSAEYEAGIKDGLSAQKMLKSIIDGVAFTDDELWKEYETANGKYTYDFVAFDPAGFISDSEPAEEELKKYYDKNSFRFTVPTKVKLFYARAGFRAMGKKITIADEDIKRYYEANSYDFFREKEVRASHILIKPVKGDVAGAQIKAEGILKRFKAGENFAKLAREYSEDRGSAKKGGDLGFFGLGTMLEQFEDTAFSLKKNETSGLVKTVYGFHIIKVVDIKEEGVKPLSEVRDDIRAILIKAQAVFAATDSIESLRELFEGNGNIAELEKAVSDAGLTSTKTNFISEGGRGGVILSDEMLKNAAFGLNQGGVSAPVETADGIYLIKVIERVESHVAPFEESRIGVKEGYKREMAVEGAKKAADEVLKRLLAKEPFEKVLKEQGLNSQTSKEVIREQAFIGEIGLYIGDIKGIFDLTLDAPYHPEVISHANGFYIFSLKAFSPAERAPFDKDKEAIRAKYLEIKRAKAQNDWVNKLREKAEITVNRDYL